MFSFHKPKRTVKARSTRSFFPLRLSESNQQPYRPTTTSPHPYASPEISAGPEVFDITDYNAEIDSQKSSIPPLQSHSTGDMDSQISGLPYDRYSVGDASESSALRREESPQVKLDINLSPEPLSDLFPAHFLNSDSPPSQNLAPSEQMDGQETKELYESRLDDRSDDQDGERSFTSDDEVIAHLKAMDASTFVIGQDVPTAIGPPPTDPHVPKVQRKTAPAPIKIPNVSLHGPKVQIIRSSTNSQTPRSRPTSATSLDEASAVSGTTLARALLANTFVLSGDRRASRYRSGASSVLTRTDSAVLPKGDHPFLNSPYGRERTLSATSDALSPQSRTIPPVPPVPPVPKLIDLVYIPPSANVQEGANLQERTSHQASAENGPATAEDIIVSPSSLMRSDDESHRETRELTSAARGTEGGPASNMSSSSVEGHQPSTAEEGLFSPDVPETAGSQPEQQPLSPTPTEQLSTAPSSAGREEINSVLDYYRVSDPPTTDNGYRPAFSPITEESSSQLSPPTPFNGRHGKLILSTVSSTSSPGGRIDWSPSPGRSRPGSQNRPQGLTTNLLPIGDRPRSFQTVPVSPTAALSPGTPASQSSPDVLMSPLDLAPPPISSIFNRQRSGSAPSPIKVVRDSKDYNKYNITVTPGPESPENTPSTGNSDYATQTFPETPSAFSPIWSPGSSVSPGYPRSSFAAASQATSVGPISNNMTSLAQRVLLTRAATSIRNARHSRQASITRARTVAPSSLTEHRQEEEQIPASDPVPPHPPAVEKDNQSTTSRDDVHVASDAGHAEDNAKHSHSRQNSRHSVASSHSLYSVSGTENDHDHRLSLITDPLPPTTAPPVSIADMTSTFGPSNNSSQMSLRLKDLPALPPSSSETSFVDTPVSQIPTTSQALPEFSLPAMAPLTPPASGASPLSVNQNPPPPLTPPPSSPPPPSHDNFVSPPSPLPPPPPAEPITISRTGLESPPLGSPFSATFGSPPSYDSIMLHDTHTPIGNTPPSTAQSGLERSFNLSGALSPSTPSSYTGDRRAPARDSSSTLGGGRRGRIRPPLPAGPRRPQSNPLRQRNLSISSSTSAATRPRTASATLPSPRFQTPPVKWRGYPMDAAKWTFTSSQLQAIVSRAIRHSAEASSIRLLRLETLDNEIPDEMHRLDMQRTDIKARYKMLARRRNGLLSELVSHLSSEDNVGALSVVEDLKGVSSSLDKLAEELHSVDEQLSQLNSLRDVHSASALAMALRKLNASFLKEYADNQELRSKIAALEAERDEAWKQAEEVANDYDHLQEKIESPSSEPRSKRSSRVIASRKSSIRVSKAGLRSARSSMSSAPRTSISLPSGARSAFSIDDAPPVPPIPRRRRPTDIVTDIPPRISAMSTEGTTPNSETRAMMRAHEELCEMLGISSGSDIRLRRSHSARGSRPTDGDALFRSSSRPDSSYHGNSRPTSLPGTSGLNEVYNVMNPDRHAILATLGILAD